jgi:hypothetical protein
MEKSQNALVSGALMEKCAHKGNLKKKSLEIRFVHKFWPLAIIIYCYFILFFASCCVNNIKVLWSSTQQWSKLIQLKSIKGSKRESAV